MKQSLLFYVLSFLLLTNTVTAEEYPRYLSIAAIFQDEAEYLEEWIEYYLMQGVEHFYLYNNLSQDNFEEVLAPYIEQGIVELIDWPYTYSYRWKWSRIQKRSIQDAITRSKKETKWLMIVDTDEFIVPAKQKSVARLLKRLEKKKDNARVAQYHFHWVVFGTSGVEKIPEWKLMTETLTLNSGPSKVHKSIVRPEFVALDQKMDAHFSTLTNGRKSLNVSPVLAAVHHYMFRDQEYMHRVKIPRRIKMGSNKKQVLKEEATHNRETEYSYRMERFIPELKERIGALRWH